LVRDPNVTVDDMIDAIEGILKVKKEIENI